MGGVLFANILATIAVLAPLPLARYTPFVIVTNGGLLAMMTAAALVRPHWVTGALLAGILAFYFWYSLVPAL